MGKARRLLAPHSTVARIKKARGMCEAGALSNSAKSRFTARDG